MTLAGGIDCPRCEGCGTYSELAFCTTCDKDCACNGPMVSIPCSDCAGTGAMITTTVSGADVIVLSSSDDRYMVRYVETGAVRSIPRDAA